MFTEEGRWKGVIISEIKDYLPKLKVEQLEEVLEFVRCQKIIGDEDSV